MSHLVGAFLTNQDDPKEVLVPINLNVELPDGKRFQDSFCYNLYEKLNTPESFAALLCKDAQVNPAYVPLIASAISYQLDSFIVYVPPAKGEMLIAITLDLRHGDLVVQDRFLWDINNQRNDPDVFALSLVTDLGLPDELGPIISISIREQIQAYVKALVEGRADPPYSGPQNAFIGLDDEHQWWPRVERLNQTDLEKLQLVKGREERAARRRGGGVIASGATPSAYTPDAFSSRTPSSMLEEKPNARKRLYDGADPTNPSRRQQESAAEAMNYDPDTKMRFCIHCGMSEQLTTSMRKGPKGFKTLCAKCGMYWLHHQRMRELQPADMHPFPKGWSLSAAEAKQQAKAALATTPTASS